MEILALETATPAGSVALARGGEVVAARAGDPSRPHATRLPGDLLALVDEAGQTIRDLDRLAVCLGPGGFTGLRIGIAAVQGLAMATGLPVTGVSAFDALAAAAVDRMPEASSVAIWLEAGRGEVFAARYLIGERGAEPIDDPVAAPPEAVIEGWSRGASLPVCWIGNAVARYERVIREAPGGEAAMLAEPVPLIAPWVAVLAGQRPAGRPHALQPVYVRRPDAEIARARRLLRTVEP